MRKKFLEIKGENNLGLHAQLMSINFQLSRLIHTGIVILKVP